MTGPYYLASKRELVERNRRDATNALGGPKGGPKLGRLYYHDVLRVAPADRVEVMPEGRRCACGKKLTQYNRADSCYSCQSGAS